MPAQVKWFVICKGMAQSFSSSACGGSPPAKRWEGGAAYRYVLSLQCLTPIPFACAKVLPPITIEGRKRGAVLQNAICLHRLNGSLYVKEWHSLFLPPLAGEVRLRSRWEGGAVYL